MNQIIIDNFDKLVKKNQEDMNLAIEQKNTTEQRKQSFRLRTNKRILAILKKYPEEITIENYKDLQQLDGIGKGTITKLQEILETGKLSDLKGFKINKNSKEEIISELEKVINIGRSKAIELYNLGIKSVNDLKNKVKKNEIDVNDKVKLGLKYYNNFQEKIPRKHIIEIEKFLKDRIKYLNKKEGLTSKNHYLLEICGSYRRQKPFSGDIDVLITKKNTKDSSKDLDKHLPKIIKMLKKPWQGNDFEPLLVDNLTDITPTKYMGFARFKNKQPLRIDIRFVSYDSFYTALLYFTGSGEFNKVMRNIAKDKGYKLSEYGLFKISNNEKINIKSEKNVFDMLGMDYLEPKLR